MKNLKETEAVEGGAVWSEPHLLFTKWVRGAIGVSRMTGWRWRRDGLIRCTNFMGRWFIAKSEAEKFQRRLAAGEFAVSRQPIRKASPTPESEA